MADPGKPPSLVGHHFSTQRNGHRGQGISSNAVLSLGGMVICVQIAGMPGDSLPAGVGVQFVTTHWSMVLAAGGQLDGNQKAALEALCQAYWYPLYAYVRRSG